MNEQPIYQLPDDDDDKNVGLEEYLLPDEEVMISGQNPDNDVENVERRKPVSPFMAMLRVMIGPVEGWKALKRSAVSPERFAAGCFYPLLGLAALTEGADLFYEANRTLPDVMVDGVVAFITYFFGYFLAVLLSGIIMPSDCREVMKRNFSKVFLMTAMSTLVLFHILLNLLPMFSPVLVFLPLWTIYLIVRGVRLLRVPKDRESAAAGLLSLLVIACPLFCNWLLGEILPR